MPTLYIVATPIGNLQDITLRALRVLKEVDIVLCEDTRVTKKLFEHYDIAKPLISYHQHSRLEKIEEILGMLKEGKDLALVSDAGTPGVSDPGNELVREIVEKLSEVSIVPVPGASALTALAGAAGLSMDRFLFLGFPPAKKGRNKFFEQIAQSRYPVIFYESPHRIVKTLHNLQGILQKSVAAGYCSIVVGRELTKKFETIYRGTPKEVMEQVASDGPRGEFVVAVASPRKA